MISLNNIISYFYKYAQEAQPNELSFQEEVDINDSIQYVLNPVLQSQFQIGKDKANEILAYFKQKLIDKQSRKFVDASYIDQIVGNLVYQKMPDQQIQTLIGQLLGALSDQGLKNDPKLPGSGSFTPQLIKPSVDRWKIALTKMPRNTNPNLSMNS